MKHLNEPPNNTRIGAPQADISVRFSSFSVQSPYLVTSSPREWQINPATPDVVRYRNDDPGYDSKYLKTISPLWQSLSGDMQTLMRKELQIIFFEVTAHELRFEDTYASKWRQISDIPCVKWRPSGEVDIEAEGVIQFLNKEVMIYLDTEVVGYGDLGLLGRYIYREWLHLYNGRPPFQRGSFFAQAARFHDKVPDGLDRLSGFHRDLSQMLSAHLDDYVDFYPYDARSQVIPPPHYQPIPSRAVHSFRDHGYLLRPLFRALYIFVDNQAYAEDYEPLPVQRGEAECFIEYRQRVYIHRMSQVTVLLVKSGDESQLSSPISFLPLFDAGLALYVNREDYKDGVEPTVARVALDVAIRFIWELLMKEEAAAQEAAKVAEGLRKEQSAFCEAWVSKVIAHSQEIGIDANGYSWLAIRRALARKNGEAFDDDQVNPMWEWLRHWTA